MKAFIFFSAILLTLISCRTTINSAKHIDSSAISRIELLIADTSIVDLPSKQLTKLIAVGEGQSFVDSSGNPFHKPSQIITFINSDKDSLVSIFNSFLNSSQQDEDATTCITLYNHVFLLYDTKNTIAEQVDFAFDCPMQFDFLHRCFVSAGLTSRAHRKKKIQLQFKCDTALLNIYILSSTFVF
jgi:hypothetical protein